MESLDPRHRSRRRYRTEPVLRIGRWDVSWLLPAALLVAIAVGDWNTSGDFRIITWIVLVPAIASAVCGVLTTAFFAVAASATYAAIDTAWSRDYQQGPADLLLVVAAGGLSVMAAWLRMRALADVLSLENAAEATRLAVLRPIPPGAGGLEAASAYLAADTAARVGGDFFDVQPSAHGPRVLLGDVQGKGTGAVDAAAALLGTFRECAYHEPDLATVARHLEVRMHRHNRHDAMLGRGEDRFATAVLVGFPPPEADGPWLELVNFGHPGPIVLGRDGVRTLPEGIAQPLGLGLALGPPTTPPPILRLPFSPADTLLLFTDGVTEARDPTGVFLPLTDRLSTTTDPTPSAVVDLLQHAVLTHTRGRLADDTAILAVRRMGAAGEERAFTRRRC